MTPEQAVHHLERIMELPSIGPGVQSLGREAVRVLADAPAERQEPDRVLVSHLDWCIGYASTGPNENGWAEHLTERLTEARTRAALGSVAPAKERE